MSRLPIFSGPEVVRILKKLRYENVRQRGSHMRLTCPGRKPITVPNYKTIDRRLLHKILRDAELSAEDFLKLV